MLALPAEEMTKNDMFDSIICRKRNNEGLKN